MKLRLLTVGLLVSCSVMFAQEVSTLRPAHDEDAPFLTKLQSAISRHLGRPYVWGATGLKSYDCSGFIWRVLTDSGVLIKRSTARKYYLAFRKVKEADKWNYGTVVFFDDLKHVGIVHDNTRFYHAQLSKGTNLSPYEPYWRPKIYGFRALPLPAPQASPQPVTEAAR